MSMNFCFDISQQFLFEVSSLRLEINGARRTENSIDYLTNCDGAMEMEEERMKVRKRKERGGRGAERKWRSGQIDRCSHRCSLQQSAIDSLPLLHHKDDLISLCHSSNLQQICPWSISALIYHIIAKLVEINWYQSITSSSHIKFIFQFCHQAIYHSISVEYKFYTFLFLICFIFRMSSVLQRRQFSLMAAVFQLIFIGILWVFGRYIDPLDDNRRVYAGTDYPCELFCSVFIWSILFFRKFVSLETFFLYKSLNNVNIFFLGRKNTFPRIFSHFWVRSVGKEEKVVNFSINQSKLMPKIQISSNSSNSKSEKNSLKLEARFRYNLIFPSIAVFQDVHLMIFVGFGFLMAFLKRYGFSAVSVNLLLSSFVVQYSMVLRGFLSKKFHDTGFFTIGIPE